MIKIKTGDEAFKQYEGKEVERAQQLMRGEEGFEANVPKAVVFFKDGSSAVIPNSAIEETPDKQPVKKPDAPKDAPQKAEPVATKPKPSE